MIAVDLGARRVLRRERIDGVMQIYARLPHGLALLVMPPNTIGPAKLVVSDDSDGSGPRIEQAIPALAADPDGQRLYVVPGRGPLAEVELAGLEVTYHRLARAESPLRRLARWWTPPAEAKIVSGPSRTGLWLGGGQLAVTGYDGSATGHHVETPSGLELIDTASWTVRQVDRRSGAALLAGGRLLAFGSAFGTGQNGANRGYGLTLYGPGDRRPTHRFGAQEVGWVQVYGDLADVHLLDPNLGDLEDTAVVDLPSGRVLDTLTGNLPELLVPDQV